MEPGNNSIVLAVKIIPNTSQNGMVRWEGELLVLKIKGVPEKGKVNENLIAFLAQTFGIAKRYITIVSGKTSRLKRVRIEGVAGDELRVKLDLLCNTKCRKEHELD